MASSEEGIGSSRWLVKMVCFSKEHLPLAVVLIKDFHVWYALLEGMILLLMVEQYIGSS